MSLLNIEVEVWKYHSKGLEHPRKKTMLFKDFLKLPKQENYYYRSFQIGYNQTIIIN